MAAIVSVFFALVLVPPALAAADGPRLDAARKSLESIGYRCKIGTDVPDRMGRPDASQVSCFRGSVKTTQLVVQLFGSPEGAVKRLEMWLELGQGKFTTADSSGWFTEVAGLLLSKSDQSAAAAWIQKQVKANRPYSAQAFGQFGLTIMSEYDVPKFHLEVR